MSGARPRPLALAAQEQTNCEQAAVHYRQALEVGEAAAASLALANSPKHVQMVPAHAALVRRRLGKTCAASRTFQSLVPDGGAVPAWIREPFAAFEMDLAANVWCPEEMACALRTTEAHRAIGVCPKVAVRVEFATDSAAIDAANGAKVRALADALHR